MKTGKEIRRQRRANDVTQKELAEMAKITEATLCSFEKGGNFRADTYKKIINALKKTSHDS